MESATKYRLGNQPEEYELHTGFIGWIPCGYKSWHEWFLEDIDKETTTRPEKLTIVSPDKTQAATLLMRTYISKDAFPMSFFSEGSSRSWHRFYIASTKEQPDIRFIIPLH